MATVAMLNAGLVMTLTWDGGNLSKPGCVSDEDEDVIMLMDDDFEGNSAECGSCHDVDVGW